MIKRIWNLFQQDLANSLRDNLVLYMMVAPLLLAVGAKFFLPSLDQVTIRIALDESSVQTTMIDSLENYGVVELLPTSSEVISRVERNDGVIGVYQQDGEYKVILQGNEEEGEEIAHILMSAVNNHEQIASYTVIENSQKSLLTEYGTISLIMMAILLGAVVAGIHMVLDKESGAIKALAVSPLKMSEYTAARAVFAWVLGAILIFGISLIMVGSSINYWLLLVGFICSFGIAILLGYVIGGFGETQVQAMSLLKILMMVYLTIPIVSIFIPRGWHFLFYVLPNYWMFTVFENIFVGQVGPVGFWGASLLTLGSSMIMVLILMPILRKRLKLG